MTAIRNHRSDIKKLCASFIREEDGVSRDTKERILLWTQDGQYLYAGDVDVRIASLARLSLTFFTGWGRARQQTFRSGYLC